MLEKIKQIYNNIIEKIIIHKEQRTIFSEAQAGDLLWCSMPLRKKELQKIEESHRTRPYLVVEKGNNFLLCYQSSSKNREELNNYQKYFINAKKYRNKKDSWIDLTDVKKIKIKNIKSPYMKLNQIDIKKIEKRIIIGQYRENYNLIRFNEPILLEAGDVVVKDKISYYIYADDNVNVYGFKIQKYNKEKEKLEKQLKFMKENDCAFSFTDYEFADSNGIPNGKKVKVPKTINYNQALKNTTIFTSTVMFDLGKLTKEEILMPDVRRGQDTATWWKVLKIIDYAHGINGIYSYYRRNENTLSSNKIKALKRTWNLYRNVEHLGIISSSYNFCWYCFNALKRRV